VYTSEHAHSSIEKGAIAIGVGQNNVRKIPVDAEFRMRPELLEAAIQRDLANGKKPFYVAATVGTTSSSSIDPVPAIADIAERYGLWLHVDAAYGGSPCVVPEFRHFLNGAERADSIVLNPHKWLFVPMDLSAFYTRKPEILRRAFSLVAEYLKTAADPRALNPMDYGVQLGRRFRALKFWFVLRYYGHEGICRILREHVAMAQELAGWVEADERFEIAAPHPLALVCFRLKAGDDATRRLLAALDDSGETLLSHTVLNGRYVVRFAIGNIKTTREDVASVWRLIQRTTEKLAAHAETVA
jgi:aromatic-L-amino-acid decarboxylase